MQVIGSLISVRPSSFADSQDTHFNTFEGKSYEYRITEGVPIASIVWKHWPDTPE